MVILLLVGIAGAIYYAYHEVLARRENRRKCKALLAELEALPPVKADFSTPEGAILCLEETYRRRDIEAAVACRNFAAEARLWLQERDMSQQLKDEMLPKVTRTMEKSFRDGMANRWPVHWDGAKSYFQKREPFAEGVVVVSEITLRADRSFLRQQILAAETANGWRVVTQLPSYPGEPA